MGREIEIKIPLTDSEFDDIYDFIQQKKKYGGISIKTEGKEISRPQFFLKKDEYYSKYETETLRRKNQEPPVIRIRTENAGGAEKSYFTIKRKAIEDGIEVNKEDETFIQDANVLRNFFELAGYKRWFYKEKKACGVYCSFEQFLDVTFHLELEIVNNLKYVEIEVTDTACSSRDVKQSLNDFVKALNLDLQKKDTRSWVALLTEC